ncbi:MAG: cytochrome c oxidase subunit 3 [Flavobacteriales bacterium]
MNENSKDLSSSQDFDNGVFANHPPEVMSKTKKMMMYFIIFAIVMLFGGFTSAYILLNTNTYWVHINPTFFLNLSLVFLVLSSVTMILANRSVKKGKIKAGRNMLLVTFFLGFGFTFAQLTGWQELKNMGMGTTVVETENGPATSWNNIEKITGEYMVDYYVHHDGQILDYQNGNYYAATDPLKEEPINNKITANTNSSGAFIWVLIWVHIIHLALGLMYLLYNVVRLSKDKIGPEIGVQVHNNGIYWHFMGILWVYLFVFLFIIH